MSFIEKVTSPTRSCCIFIHYIVITTPTKLTLPTEDQTLAIPGFNTTAYTILETYSGRYKSIVVLPYEEMLEAIHNDTVDCALIIHELQFWLKRLVLLHIVTFLICGKKKLAYPLPLGGLFLKGTHLKQTTLTMLLKIPLHTVIQTRQRS